MLKSDPIFFRSLNKGKGRRRTVFQVENPEEQIFSAPLTSIEGPEWLHIERVITNEEVQIFEPTPGSDDVADDVRDDRIPGVSTTKRC